METIVCYFLFLAIDNRLYDLDNLESKASIALSISGRHWNRHYWILKDRLVAKFVFLLRFLLVTVVIIRYWSVTSEFNRDYFVYNLIHVKNNTMEWLIGSRS